MIISVTVCLVTRAMIVNMILMTAKDPHAKTTELALIKSMDTGVSVFKVLMVVTVKQTLTTVHQVAAVMEVCCGETV